MSRFSAQSIKRTIAIKS